MVEVALETSFSNGKSEVEIIHQDIDDKIVESVVNEHEAPMETHGVDEIKKNDNSNDPKKVEPILIPLVERVFATAVIEISDESQVTAAQV